MLPPEFRYGIEVRNPELVQQATLDLCARHHAAFVLVDRSPSINRWAGVIRGLLSKDMPVFVFANNHYAGHAPATLRRLEKSIAILGGEAEDEIWRPDLFS